jgi:hypothetical protein
MLLYNIYTLAFTHTPSSSSPHTTSSIIIIVIIIY